MSTTFKNFLNNDVTVTRTLLHESIPITGTLVSGTYADENIKTYAHGMWESVYDYPYLSSSANHIFDISCGYASDSSLSGAWTQNAKKINIYNQMAKILVGHDVTGTILKFDQDGDLVAGGTKLNEVYFINFARLLAKDEIKKGSLVMQFGTGSYTTPWHGGLKVLGDYGAANEYRVNSPAGEYGILYTSSVEQVAGTGQGLIFYQAGIAVVSSSFFTDTGGNSAGMNTDEELPVAVLSGSSIAANADALRYRLDDISFNNTTELNSTIYFCRINHNEFNYSSNPTYLSGSKIRVKDNTIDEPVSYITSVGLYSADNELLAVAKLSEPLKKTPQNELILRVRLDY